MQGLGSFIVRRVAIAVPLLVLVSIISFSTLYFRTDPALAIAGPQAAPEDVERIREQMNLDEPLHVQYYLRMRKLFTEGSFGTSFKTGEPVEREIMERFSATFELTFAAMSIAIFFGVGFGVLSAVYRQSIIDYFSLGFALLGVSIPVFFLGILLIILFSGQLNILPAGGRSPPATLVNYSTHFYVLESIIRGDFHRTVTFLRYLLLPSLALATIPMAVITRIARSSMLDVLHSNYIRAAYAKGLSPFTVIFKHGLRNAMIDITTISGIQIGYLLGGAVLTEWVFNWPGLGQYLVNRILEGDYMAVQAGLFVTATVFIVMNFLVDLSYALIDPRVGYGEAGNR